MKPVIGITCNRFDPNPNRDIYRNMSLHFGEEVLLQTIYRLGGLPLLIPDLNNSDSRTHYLAQIDGLLLSGGEDVSPLSYQKTDFDPKWPGDLRRDQFEIALIHQAFKLNKPIFGICRGLQILNVAFGGSLHQDITEHHHPDFYEQHTHSVKLEKNSWLMNLLGNESILVNSVHHQAIDRLAEDFFIAARADTQINCIEAIEHCKKNNIKAVQWHPEWAILNNKNINYLELILSDFIKMCKI